VFDLDVRDNVYFYEKPTVPVLNLPNGSSGFISIRTDDLSTLD
jgi:hypothetical protein